MTFDGIEFAAATICDCDGGPIKDECNGCTKEKPMNRYPTEGDDIAFHMTGVVQLIDRFNHVTGSMTAPDTVAAKKILVDIMCRCGRAHQLLTAFEERKANEAARDA